MPSTRTAPAPEGVAFGRSLTALADDELLAEQDAVTEERRRLDVRAALIAAEIARRSRAEAGFDGLAQRLGARTPEALVQLRTGVTAAQAGALVRVGELVATDPAAAFGTSPVAASVLSGALSIEAADAIQSALDHTADAGVPSELRADVAHALVTVAPSLTVEQLAARAREAGAALHDAAASERELRDRRFLRITRLPDGMTRLIGLLDPESAAIVTAAYDAATSPRRGGPRFVDAAEAARAERITRDARTTDQLALDAFVDLVRVGTLADTGAVLGARKPAVRVMVTARDLQRGVGAAHLEGQTVPVSVATAQRAVCEAGALLIGFDDDGQVLNVGRAQRLFTSRQRFGLATRDGGCRFPGCDRPPTWCEAHHVDEWDRDRGRTDIADGVLLCRRHHLLVHDNGWRIARNGAEYYAVPPPTLDPRQQHIPMPTKSPIMRRLAAG